MDVSWYVAEALVRERLAELRASAARHCPPVGTDSPRPASRGVLGPAALRLRQRLFGGLGVARAAGWRRLG